MFVRLFLILGLLSTQGCCGLFALFGCGTGVPVVPVTWDSPQEAVRTFLAGVRASDAKVVYESLAESFKEANNLDGLKVAVGWKLLREKMPYLHLLGDAKATPVEQGRQRWRFRLDAHGYLFAAEFRAQPYWDLGYWGPEGKEVLELGSYVDSTEKVIDAVEPGTNKVIVRIDDPSLFGLERDQIAFVKAGTVWKLTLFQREAEDAPDDPEPSQ